MLMIRIAMMMACLMERKISQRMWIMMVWFLHWIMIVMEMEYWMGKNIIIIFRSFLQPYHSMIMIMMVK